MLPARLHSVVVSLTLHAGLLGVAATSSSASSFRAPVARRAALETSIAVEAAEEVDGAGRAASPAPPPPAEESSKDEVPSAVVPRERRVRPSAAVERAIPRAPLPAPAAAARPVEPAPTTPSPPTPDPPVTVAPGASTAAEATGPGTARPGVAGLFGGRGSARPGAAGGGARGGDGPGSTVDAKARAEQLARYLAGVRARVAQHRDYPYLARRASMEGTVCLRVSIAASGRVLGVTPTCGAAQEPLLQAALKSVSSAAPFPPLPAALGARLTLDVPVVFELDAL